MRVPANAARIAAIKKQVDADPDNAMMAMFSFMPLANELMGPAMKKYGYADQENGGDDAVAPAAKRPRQAVDQDLVQRVKVRMNLSKKPTIPQMKLALPVEAHPPQKQWVDYAKAIENYTGTLNAPEAPAPTSNRQEEAAPAPDTLRAALREMR